MTPPTLVLLHGWGLMPTVWTELARLLPTAIRVQAPALPGHGAPAAGAATLAAWTDALVGALPDGAVVCGWSLGGMLALDLARRHPAKVARLILIGSTPRFVASNDGAWTHGLDAATVAGFIAGFAADPAATLRRFVALQALGDATRRSVTASLNGALAAAVDGRSQALADGLRLLAETDLRGDLDGVLQPAHLLHGANDALMPLGAAEWLAAHLPKARLTTFDDCGHAPFLSRPAECAALIAETVLE